MYALAQTIDDCGDMSDEMHHLCVDYPNRHELTMLIGFCEFWNSCCFFCLYRCDFETDMCEWQNSVENKYNWHRIAALSSPLSYSPDLMPQRDHTTNTDAGSYMYVDTKGRALKSRSALYGPAFLSKNLFDCHIYFYVYMDGESIGRLNLLVRPSNSTRVQMRSSRVGPLGQHWQSFHHRFSFRAQTFAAFQVILEAEADDRNTTGDGIIALDDIKFGKGCLPAPSDAMGSGGDEDDKSRTSTPEPTICGRSMFLCVSEERCIGRERVCDFVKDCLNGEDEAECGACDFESGMCGWSDESDGEHFWNRTQAYYTSISKDMTTGTPNGSFVHYEQTSDLVLGAAKLITPRLGKTSAHCELRFWFYKEDRLDESVFFSLNMLSGSGRQQLGRQRIAERLWYTDENSSGKYKAWRQVQVGLHAKEAGFQLFFQVNHVKTGRVQTLLAVDDTAYLYCGRANNVSCAGNEVFQCANGMCVPNYMVKLS